MFDQKYIVLFLNTYLIWQKSLPLRVQGDATLQKGCENVLNLSSQRRCIIAHPIEIVNPVLVTTFRYSLKRFSRCVYDKYGTI